MGRAVAATAIARYGVDPDARRRYYVRSVGDAVVRLAGRPLANFGGYHFEVLNSDAVNAISGPGGFVLITRGAVNACTCEAELAAILSHELGHIVQKHGERTIRKSTRFKSLVQSLGRTGASALKMNDDRALAQLVKVFDQAVGEMARTAMENQYGKELEFQADAEAVTFLYDAGYNHAAIQQILLRRATTHRGTATHAAPGVRASAVARHVAHLGPSRVTQEAAGLRHARFQRWTAIRRIK